MSDLTVLPVTVEHHREPLGIGETAAAAVLAGEHRRCPTGGRPPTRSRSSPRTARCGRPAGSTRRSRSCVPWGAPPLASRERRVGPGPGLGRGRHRAVGVERGRRRRGRTAGPGGLVGAARPARAAGAGHRRRARGAAPARVRPGPPDRPGAAVRDRAGPVRGRAQRRRRSATRCSRPGWTSYQHRLRYQTYDVTDLLRRGHQRDRRPAGRRLVPRLPRLRRQAERLRRPAPGRSRSSRSSTPTAPGRSIASDGSWRSTLGPLTRADIYSGETFDARRELTGWSAAGFDDAAWTPVEVGSLDVAHTGRADRAARAPHPDPARRGDHHLAVGEDAGRLRAEPGGPAATAPARRPGRHRDHRPARRGARARRARHPAAARRPRRPTSSCWTGTGRAAGSRGSPSTASATPRSPAGRVSSPPTTSRPSSCTPTCDRPARSPAPTRT